MKKSTCEYPSPHLPFKKSLRNCQKLNNIYFTVFKFVMLAMTLGGYHLLPISRILVSQLHQNKKCTFSFNILKLYVLKKSMQIVSSITVLAIIPVWNKVTVLKTNQNSGDLIKPPSCICVLETVPGININKNDSRIMLIIIEINTSQLAVFCIYLLYRRRLVVSIIREA